MRWYPPITSPLQSYGLQRTARLCAVAHLPAYGADIVTWAMLWVSTIFAETVNHLSTPNTNDRVLLLSTDNKNSGSQQHILTAGMLRMPAGALAADQIVISRSVLASGSDIGVKGMVISTSLTVPLNQSISNRHWVRLYSYLAVF